MSTRYWTQERIVAALQAWADANGRAPYRREWMKATIAYPASQTVHEFFGTWTKGVLAAGLQLPPRTNAVQWGRDEIVHAIDRWSLRYRRLPKEQEWKTPPPGWPSSYACRRAFGSFNGALIAAGHKPRIMFMSVEEYERRAKAAA